MVKALSVFASENPDFLRQLHINITWVYDDGKTVNFICNGHAFFGVRFEDIVQAAVQYAGIAF